MFQKISITFLIKFSFQEKRIQVKWNICITIDYKWSIIEISTLQTIVFVKTICNLIFVGLQFLLLLHFFIFICGIIFSRLTLLPKKNPCFSSRSLSMLSSKFFKGFWSCTKDCSSSLFLGSTCWCAIFHKITKLCCCIKILLSISLTLQVNNLKLNFISCFALIYSFANKLVRSLFIINNIIITSLKISFICICPKSRRSALINARTI